MVNQPLVLRTVTRVHVPAHPVAMVAIRPAGSTVTTFGWPAQTSVTVVEPPPL